MFPATTYSSDVPVFIIVKIAHCFAVFAPSGAYPVIPVPEPIVTCPEPFCNTVQLNPTINPVGIVNVTAEFDVLIIFAPLSVWAKFLFPVAVIDVAENLESRASPKLTFPFESTD